VYELPWCRQRPASTPLGAEASSVGDCRRSFQRRRLTAGSRRRFARRRGSRTDIENGDIEWLTRFAYPQQLNLLKTGDIDVTHLINPK
jgi:hypothetical protein